LISALRSRLEAEQWGYGGGEVEVYRDDRTWTAAVSSRDTRLITEQITDVSAIASVVNDVTSAVCDLLDVRGDYSFLGIRTQWVAAVDSFDELRDRMADRLGGSLSSVFSVVDQPLTDAGWVWEFHGVDPKYSVRFGPMTREQGLQVYFYEVNEERVPLEFLFVDFDRVINEQPVSRHRSEQVWADDLRASISVAEQVAAGLASAIK
jgi:hypothetical protein